MTGWGVLTPADLERFFAAEPEILAAVVAWIDDHPDDAPELDVLVVGEVDP